MNSGVAVEYGKPLPPPARNEDLPSPPPSDPDASWNDPPSIPAKIDGVQSVGYRAFDSANAPSNGPVSRSNHGAAPPTPSKSGPSLSIPSSPSADGRTKKSNPLTDLIDTERAYVELLAGIIRRVAGAWSRSNLPPQDLDTMFRGIESIYKANRSLLSKLRDIGTNPSSPKALGDLLMRWIDDLEAPYTAYCNNFLIGFDAWEPVRSNDRLRTVLAMFSASNPPPLPPSSPAHPSQPVIWTLDELFLLPTTRLKYYQKLYSRLLKSTAPGRGDHRLLAGAMAKLERLLATLDIRAGIRVDAIQRAAQLSVESEEEAVTDTRSRDRALQSRERNLPPENVHASTHDSRRDTTAVSNSRISTSSIPVVDLERRLSTQLTLDIFTMRPKQVRLQISPPSLHFAREVRFPADVVIQINSQATGMEVIQERGRIFILTDLLLVCDRMTPEERAQFGRDGPDMWLSYPPLAGKHLRVAPVNNSNTALAVTVMRKETLILHAESPGLRDRLLAEFRDCVDAAASLQASSQNPPPVPTLLNIDTVTKPLPSVRDRSQSSAGGSPEWSSGSMSLPSRILSPSSASSRSSNDQRPLQSSRSSSGSADVPLANSMGKLTLASESQRQHPEQRQSNSTYPPRSSSVATHDSGAEPGQLVRGPSFSPGQVVPSQAINPGQLARGPSFGPGQVIPPQSVNPGQLARGPPFGPRQVVPPQSFAPGQRAPPPGSRFDERSAPQLFCPGQVKAPSRDGSLRSIPPNSVHGPPQFAPEQPSNDRSVRTPGPPGAVAGSGHPAPFARSPARPPSDPTMQGGLRNRTSTRSLRSQSDMLSTASAPPMPAYPNDLAPPRRPFLPRTGSSSSVHSLPSQLHPPQTQLLPSEQLSLRSVSTTPSFVDPSPPSSPVEETPPPIGPTTTSVTAQMKCKVFLQQHHEQWKSLGAAKLILYCESPTNVKQLVVEADNKDKTVLISTIVLVDGVERVGKTGVAVELSDRGQRSGIIYMIQLRNEKSAGGLFDSLIAGSDRSKGRS